MTKRWRLSSIHVPRSVEEYASFTCRKVDVDILSRAIVPRKLGHGSGVDAGLDRLLNRRNELLQGSIGVTGKDLQLRTRQVESLSD